jgi:hypothetical protein
MDTDEKLHAYAREASIALARISGGGSEMFKRIGDEFYADPNLCVQRAQEKLEHAWRYGGRAA